MSGRDAEPIAAFFPSIDRSLMRDLDRHLRNPQQASPQAALEAAAVPRDEPVPPKATPHLQGAARPTVDTIVEAVEQAASTMAAMTNRIQSLEETIDELQLAQHDTAVQLAETVRRNEETEASLRTERERGARAETLAAHHVARANRLEVELGKAMSDLTRVTDAIASTLGLPDQQ